LQRHGAIRRRKRRRAPRQHLHHQRGAHIMAGANRRILPAGLAFAAGGLALSAVLALAAPIGAARANAAEPSPLSVVQALMDAEHETDLELALSLFAKDAVIVNVIGDTIESAQLPRFL